MRRFVGTALLALALLCPAAAARAESVQEVLQRASQAVEQRRPQQALALLEARLADAGPTDDLVSLHGVLGDTYLFVNDTERALLHFDWVVQHQPDLALARFKRGAALERANRCGEAIQAYRIARDLEYDPGEAMARIGFCYRILADSKDVTAEERGAYLQRAAMALSRALQHDPNNRSALGNLADLAFNASDHRSALKLYQQMNRLDPSTPTTLARLGSTWARLGEHEKALEVLRRAAKLAEKAQPAGVADRWIQRDAAIFSRLRAGESLIALGRVKQARRQLERVLAIADCPDCVLRSREVTHSLARAEALLAQLDDGGSFPAAPAPAP